jgi:hypothetical protein
MYLYFPDTPRNWSEVCSENVVTINRVCAKHAMNKLMCLLSHLFLYNLRADWHFFSPPHSMFTQVPKILFPVMWVELRATLTPELATSFRIYLQLPTASLICSVGLLLTGLFTLGLTFLPQSVRAVSEGISLFRRNGWLHAEIFNILTYWVCVLCNVQACCCCWW